MKFFTAPLLFLLGTSSSLLCKTHAFAPILNHQQTVSSSMSLLPTYSPSPLFMFKEYGPSSGDDAEELKRHAEWNYERQKDAFKLLIKEVIHVNKRENLPRLCTQNIDLLVSLKSNDSVTICNDIMAEARRSGDQALIDNTEAAIQYVVFFVETFVTQAKAVDDQNKALLGEIIKCMIGRTSLLEEISIDDLPSEAEREQNLNRFLSANKEKFTPVFLRHLDGECQRIQAAPENTPESIKLLETIRLIQTRVVEELGKDLGEGAQVLGQLIGYESKEERLAVLEAGLTVRGVEFAAELNAMTMEALEGFKKVLGGADPSLVKIIQEINDYIQVFINKNQASAGRALN